MSWGKSLAEINSVNINDLHEYFSRPDDRVLNLVSERKDDTIVIYGATGKWTSDLTEMLLRAIQEIGIKTKKVHLVSSFRKMAEFDERFSKYSDLFKIHKVDLVNAQAEMLKSIPDDAQWIIYGVGYKFRTTETEEEYIRLCKLYGNEIPYMVFSHHKQSADIVVIGSGNGVELTTVDNQAKDDAPLVPKNTYGISIRDKENTIRKILEDNNLENSSKAVILRGGYMTDLTYGGLESPVIAVKNGNEIDLSKLTYFNIIGHRDANIYVILAVKSTSNPMNTLNLSGHTADVRKVAEYAGNAFGKKVRYIGEPAERHLLLDGSKIEKLYGPPIDSLEDLIQAQIYWIKNGGYSRALNHHVGESM